MLDGALVFFRGAKVVTKEAVAVGLGGRDDASSAGLLHYTRSLMQHISRQHGETAKRRHHLPFCVDHLPIQIDMKTTDQSEPTEFAELPKGVSLAKGISPRGAAYLTARIRPFSSCFRWRRVQGELAPALPGRPPGVL